ARDAALLDPPARSRDVERGGRGDPVRGAGLLPRARVDRRPRRLPRRTLPRPDRDRECARRPLGATVNARSTLASIVGGTTFPPRPPFSCERWGPPGSPPPLPHRRGGER